MRSSYEECGFWPMLLLNFFFSDILYPRLSLIEWTGITGLHIINQKIRTKKRNKQKVGLARSLEQNKYTITETYRPYGVDRSFNGSTRVVKALFIWTLSRLNISQVHVLGVEGSLSTTQERTTTQSHLSCEKHFTSLLTDSLNRFQETGIMLVKSQPNTVYFKTHSTIMAKENVGINIKMRSWPRSRILGKRTLKTKMEKNWFQNFKSRHHFQSFCGFIESTTKKCRKKPEL